MVIAGKSGTLIQMITNEKFDTTAKRRRNTLILNVRNTNDYK
jgi:hypothetical protein